MEAADWIDVVKFLVFNYGFHAVTALNPPGSNMFRSLYWSCYCLIWPLFGMVQALSWMRRVGLRQNDLELSLSSGALCMLVPSSFNIPDFQEPTSRFLKRLLYTVNPSWINIHGQYPSEAIPPKWTAMEHMD